MFSANIVKHKKNGRFSYNIKLLGNQQQKLLENSL